MKLEYQPPIMISCGSFAEQTRGVIGGVHEVTGYFFR